MSAAQRPVAFLVTCEHGGNRVPAAYRPWFRGRDKLLRTHEAYDPGALDMARALARVLNAPLVASTVSRLVIELNRSSSHPALFSRVIRDAPSEVRAQIYERHYLPYRTAVETFVSDAIAHGGCVVHVSSHSFTPVLHREVRNADIGLLYDPRRPLERALCERWRDALAVRLPGARVRRNYPYRGTGDGLTTYLRRRFDEDVYAGVELEINQKHVVDARAPPAAMKAQITRALLLALEAFP